MVVGTLHRSRATMILGAEPGEQCCPVHQLRAWRSAMEMEQADGLAGLGPDNRLVEWWAVS